MNRPTVLAFDSYSIIIVAYLFYARQQYSARHPTDDVRMGAYSFAESDLVTGTNRVIKFQLNG